MFESGWHGEHDQLVLALPIRTERKRMTILMLFIVVYFKGQNKPIFVIKKMKFFMLLLR